MYSNTYTHSFLENICFIINLLFIKMKRQKQKKGNIYVTVVYGVYLFYYPGIDPTSYVQFIDF